ncbi:Homoserine O-acetyltransferase [Grifola frondosa]|uniref:Homoserine O-acetyltransferase n=1 Tax=Grifola frondosa TaxID=5627 RepID=A0A1C7M518_GRIFR|nr:Homoserine O-acetyltransferase [Grifola frondosa]
MANQRHSVGGVRSWVAGKHLIPTDSSSSAGTAGITYGSASAVTTNPDTGAIWPRIPRNDHSGRRPLVLDHLGVSSVAVAIGGSMGGMAILEWPLCTPPGYVRHVIPIATSARHSAWCISWGEAQRQSIYSDPSYEDGYYQIQPASGLAASAASRKSSQWAATPSSPAAFPVMPSTDDALAAHNDGNRNRLASAPGTPQLPPSPPPIFSAQSYLRYQGDKFTSRFDANCYIHITRKLDTHDVARGRLLSPDEDESHALARVLATLPPRALVIGIQTDGLFTTSEQREIAEHVPDAELIIIPRLRGMMGSF